MGLDQPVGSGTDCGERMGRMEASPSLGMPAEGLWDGAEICGCFSQVERAAGCQGSMHGAVDRKGREHDRAGAAFDKDVEQCIDDRLGTVLHIAKRLQRAVHQHHGTRPYRQAIKVGDQAFRRQRRPACLELTHALTSMDPVREITDGWRNDVFDPGSKAHYQSIVDLINEINLLGDLSC